MLQKVRTQSDASGSLNKLPHGIKKNQINSKAAFDDPEESVVKYQHSTHFRDAQNTQPLPSQAPKQET